MFIQLIIYIYLVQSPILYYQKMSTQAPESDVLSLVNQQSDNLLKLGEEQTAWKDQLMDMAMHSMKMVY